MLKNKHVITALIVAPILSIIAYFATDYVVSERPHQALSGQSYQLVQLPNCRYASGQCGLKNGNFKVVLSGNAEQSGGLSLHLESEFSLDEAYISVVKQPNLQSEPAVMTATSEDRKQWRLNLFVPDAAKQFLQLAVTANGAVYYAESGMVFLNYETSYQKDFRDGDK